MLPFAFPTQLNSEKFSRGIPAPKNSESSAAGPVARPIYPRMKLISML
jgi:hypothetical protein